jgi:carbon storage regulator
MLVLCRKLGEKIHIGENIVITVCEIDGNRVRLGVDAPRDIAIYRQEIMPVDRNAPEHEHGGES